MGKKSSIGWTDDTDNVIVVKGGGWWCRKLSEGCANCYAAELNQNAFYGGNRLAYSGPMPELVLRRELLAGWARQTRARLHFVASMTDVFGDWVPVTWQLDMLDAMRAAPRQVFQVLTKRPEMMLQLVNLWLNIRGLERVPENIWLGCSVENQRRADERRWAMEKLRAVTFVSYEPALGPVEWTSWEFVSQIISGGESGKKARPSHAAWHRAARDFCARHGRAYFFKQWGEYYTLTLCEHPSTVDEVRIGGKAFTQWHDWGDGNVALRLGKKASGRLLDACSHQQFPAIDHPALKGRQLVAA